MSSKIIKDQQIRQRKKLQTGRVDNNKKLVPQSQKQRGHFQKLSKMFKISQRKQTAKKIIGRL